jgi:uncharacterized protein involved in outer membrane biogenesis
MSIFPGGWRRSDASGCAFFLLAGRENRDNAFMGRMLKWVGAALLLVVVLLAAVAAALKYWVGSNDFRDRVAQQISSALGAPVVLGSVTVDVWPLPAVALDKVQIKSRPSLLLERLEARPAWAPLLHGRLEIATLLVRNATLPEQAVAAIAAAFQKRQPPAKQGAGSAASTAFLPRSIVLDQVTWISAKGESTTIDARASMADDGLPRDAAVQVRKGRFQGAKAMLNRRSDHWDLRAEIASGTITGKLQYQPAGKGAAPVLQGEFDSLNLDVAALAAQSRTLTGRVDAHTALRASLRDPKALPEGLHTQTHFTVRNAVVHGLDLAEAVKTVGMNHGGETRLDTLAGNVTTEGRVVQLSNLAASSGALSATGNVTIAPSRSLSGRVSVNLTGNAVGGALGVPLVVGGTLDSPSVTLSRGALLGAAVGTLIAPGIGTGAGVKLGDQLGEGLRSLFGK